MITHVMRCIAIIHAGSVSPRSAPPALQRSGSSMELTKRLMQAGVSDVDAPHSKLALAVTSGRGLEAYYSHGLHHWWLILPHHTPPLFIQPGSTGYRYCW